MQIAFGTLMGFQETLLIRKQRNTLPCPHQLNDLLTKLVTMHDYWQLQQGNNLHNISNSNRNAFISVMKCVVTSMK